MNKNNGFNKAQEKLVNGVAGIAAEITVIGGKIIALFGWVVLFLMSWKIALGLAMVILGERRDNRGHQGNGYS